MSMFPEVRNHSVGIHVSISGKLDLSIERAKEAGCVGVFQIFTCSPRQWKATNLKTEEVAAFKNRTMQTNFQVFAHMPYLPNLSSPESKFYSRSVEVLKREVLRCEELCVQNLVLHFGSHMGTSIEQGQKRIANACNCVIDETKKSDVRLLLENSAGVKNSVGSEFRFIKEVIERIDNGSRVGVCFDTCHAFAAGYDISTAEGVERTIKTFDEEVGISKLFLIHLNDSKGKAGDGLDRHEHIGRGLIGSNGMSAILHHEDLRHIPLVLETPVDDEGDGAKDIATVKKLLIHD